MSEKVVFTRSAGKIIFCLFLTLILAVSVFSLCGCAFYYDLEETEFYAVGYRKKSGLIKADAFISALFWEGDKDGMTFEIPDEYTGIPVTSLGGYTGRGFPCPFGVLVNLPDVTWNSNEIAEGDEYETLTFNVKIGKNVERITHVYGGYYGSRKQNPDGSDTLEKIYKVCYRFLVDENNPAFYADGGKLYNKKDGSLVTEFFYE